MGRDGTVASDRGLYTSAMGGSPVRPGVGELLGTFVLVYVGCAVAVALRSSARSQARPTTR